MAYKFTQEKTKDMTKFKNFLENNKSGTFLEAATIELMQTSIENDTVKITLGNTVMQLIADTLSSASTLLKLTGKYTEYSARTGSKYGSTPQYLVLITSAVLGKNGLLLEYNGSYANATATITKYPFLLTVDSGGNPAVVAYDGNVLENAGYSKYHVFSYNSPSAPTSCAYPVFNAPQTSLAQIVPFADDPSISLPYAYAAISTQVGGEGLTEIIMNGKNYITNGYWYIEE